MREEDGVGALVGDDQQARSFARHSPESLSTFLEAFYLVVTGKQFFDSRADAVAEVGKGLDSRGTVPPLLGAATANFFEEGFDLCGGLAFEGREFIFA